MPNTTLQDIFGPNATEDINSVTITKADLAAVGLNLYPDILECQLAAIIKNAWLSFQGELSLDDGNYLIDDDGDKLGYDLNFFYKDINIAFRQKYVELDRIKLWLDFDIFESFEFDNNSSYPITFDSQNIYIDKTLLDLSDSSLTTLVGSFLDKLLKLNIPETVSFFPPEELEVFHFDNLLNLTSFPITLSIGNNSDFYDVDEVVNG